MGTQEIAPRRRGRPPKLVPVIPSWIDQVAVALRISGLDPVKASIDEVTEALNPHRRSAHVPWQQRELLPVVPVVCDLLGLSKAQIYRLGAHGRLKLVLLGGRRSATSASVQLLLQEAVGSSAPPPPIPPQLVRGKHRNTVSSTKVP